MWSTTDDSEDVSFSDEAGSEGFRFENCDDDVDSLCVGLDSGVGVAEGSDGAGEEISGEETGWAVGVLGCVSAGGVDVSVELTGAVEPICSSSPDSEP